MARREVTLDTMTVTAKSGDGYRAAADKVWELSHTKVSLAFDWVEKTASGSEWITLHPYFYATDTLLLDAKSMSIQRVELVVGKNSVPVAFNYHNDSLKVNFNKIFTAADTITLHILYKAMPYNTITGGSAAITDDRGLYFINTDNKIAGKPAQIWTQGETESNSHWMPTIDKPNTRFTTEIELLVPDTMQTLSNGALVASLKQAGGMRSDTWKMDKPIQAYAVMFAIGKYTIIKDHWKDKEVNYYVEPRYAPYARKIFNNTPEMMQYFSDITGLPYPWNKYDQVIVRDYVSGAMENTTASLFGEFMNENFREIGDKNFEDVVAHELFHQWFGDYVTCESWSNITVNESFANYSEQLWRAHKYGTASADKLANEDLRKYLSSANKADPTLVRFFYTDREVVFDRISYEKGGACLGYLHKLMGDAAFHKAMNIYLTRNALHSAEATNWRLAVEEATGQDWNWFFNEYYYYAGHPMLDIRYDFNDAAQQAIVTVTQVQEDTSLVYRLPLKTALIYGGTKTITDWDLRKKTEHFVYPYKDSLRPVIVPDYNHMLVGTYKENKYLDGWLQQYKVCNDYVNKRLAVNAAFKDLDNAVSQSIVDLALSENFPYITEYALAGLSDVKNDKLRKKWHAQVEYLVTNGTTNNVRANALNVLGEWEQEDAKPVMIEATRDSSYMVAGAALDALFEVDSLEAYKIAKQFIVTHPQADLQAAIWSVIGRIAKDEDITVFQEMAPRLFGTNKFQFAIGLIYYLRRVQNDVTFDQAVAVMASLANKESTRLYRLGLASFLHNVGTGYLEKSKHERRAERQHDEQRVDLLRGYLHRLNDSEKDPENQKQFKAFLESMEYDPNDVN
jgi:aminopeptidase N